MSNDIDKFAVGTAAPGTCPDITVGDDVVVVVDREGIGEMLPFDLVKHHSLVVRL